MFLTSFSTVDVHNSTKPGSVWPRPAMCDELVITIESPEAPDIRRLLEAHLRFSREATPPEYSFALEADRLADGEITFFTARTTGTLVGIAALKQLDGSHAEIKSMHTRDTERNRGVGRAMVVHLLDEARKLGYRRVSLETGTTEEFAPARAVYAKSGFHPCGPFGEYRPSLHNTFMTISLDTSGALPS